MNGLFEGNGILRNINLSLKYEGDFKEGLKHGFGTLINEDT